jgi:hypothetical protein
MWPTKKLVDLFKNARFSLYNITWQTARTTLELRDKEKKKIEFDLNDDLQSMSDLIKAYNELLQQTFVSIPSLKSGKTESEDDDKTPVIVSHAKKFSRRIFNDSSFERGGRFYGGWWQNCPKEIRTEIFIDDCMTNELDYSGLHPTLLYAEEGIDFHKEIGGDLYEIGPIDFVEINSGRRLAKDLLLIMINADDLNTIPSAFRRKQQKGSPLARLKDVQIFDVVEALKIKHRAISKHFHTGAGLRLQYLDSEITALIVDSFLKRNEPILLVHDSYIVRSGFEELLEDAMQLAFATVTGTNFATKIKYIDLTREDVEGLLNRNYDLRYGRKGTEQQEAEDMELYRKIAPMRSNWYKNDLRLFNLWKEELKQNLHDDWGL